MLPLLPAGHAYELENFENKEEPGQIIHFICKEPIEEGSTTLKTVFDGTTNEEVLEMILHRLKLMNDKLPSRETALAITNIEQGLLWCYRRTQLRQQRGVEGTMQK